MVYDLLVSRSTDRVKLQTNAPTTTKHKQTTKVDDIYHPTPSSRNAKPSTAPVSCSFSRSNQPPRFLLALTNVYIGSIHWLSTIFHPALHSAAVAMFQHFPLASADDGRNICRDASAKACRPLQRQHRVTFPQSIGASCHVGILPSRS